MMAKALRAAFRLYAAECGWRPRIRGFCAVAWDGPLVARRGHVAMLGVSRRALAAKLQALTKP